MDDFKEIKGHEPGHKRNMIKQFFQSANRNVNIRNTRQMSHTRLISESTDDDEVSTEATENCGKLEKTRDYGDSSNTVDDEVSCAQQTLRVTSGSDPLIPSPPLPFFLLLP